MRAQNPDTDAPIDIVRTFCRCWDRLDFDAMADLLHDDIRYHNMPLDPINGKTAVETYLRGAPARSRPVNGCFSTSPPTIRSC